MIITIRETMISAEVDKETVEKLVDWAVKHIDALIELKYNPSPDWKLFNDTVTKDWNALWLEIQESIQWDSIKGRVISGFKTLATDNPELLKLLLERGKNTSVVTTNATVLNCQQQEGSIVDSPESIL